MREAQNTIEIYQQTTGMKSFVAVFSEFGNEQIITPFFGNYPQTKVVEEIKRRNPDCYVTFRGLIN